MCMGIKLKVKWDLEYCICLNCGHCGQTASANGEGECDQLVCLFPESTSSCLDSIDWTEAGRMTDKRKSDLLGGQ